MGLGDILRKKQAKEKKTPPPPPSTEVVNKAMIPEEPREPAPVRKRGRPKKKVPNNEDIHITCNEKDLLNFHMLRLSMGPKTTHVELLRKMMEVYEAYNDVEELPMGRFK